MILIIYGLTRGGVEARENEVTVFARRRRYSRRPSNADLAKNAQRVVLCRVKRKGGGGEDIRSRGSGEYPSKVRQTKSNNNSSRSVTSAKRDCGRIEG